MFVTVSVCERRFVYKCEREGACVTEREETRTVEGGNREERKEVFPWVCVLHNQPSAVIETGRLVI